MMMPFLSREKYLKLNNLFFRCEEMGGNGGNSLQNSSKKGNWFF